MDGQTADQSKSKWKDLDCVFLLEITKFNPHPLKRTLVPPQLHSHFSDPA